jgi:predicted nucleotidyltransferase
LLHHHEAAIDRVVARCERDDSILAVLLAGSIAHGFASPDSDVDIMLVVSDDDLAGRRERHETTLYDEELAGYEGGYVDGKYVSAGYLDEVAARGSEPARFAFADATVLFSRIAGLEQKVEAASRYPVEGVGERIARFAAQLEAWRWYSTEAQKKSDPYLMATASSKVVLFSARLLLAHNQTLYPFHKWMLRVLEAVPDKPEGIVDQMRSLAAAPSAAGTAALADTVLSFRDWQRGTIEWPEHFLYDTEQAWMRSAAAVDDL